MSILSSNIKYLRKQRGWSQEYISNKLGYKSYTTIQKWESGVAEPPIKKLKELSDLFDVTMTDMTSFNLEMSTALGYCSFTSWQREFDYVWFKDRLEYYLKLNNITLIDLVYNNVLSKDSLFDIEYGTEPPREEVIESLASYFKTTKNDFIRKYNTKLESELLLEGAIKEHGSDIIERLLLIVCESTSDHVEMIIKMLKGLRL